jgi:exodeoxyribonuclease-3
VRIVTWNVNGLRSILSKTLISFVEEVNADILCLQETKVDNASVPDLSCLPYEFRTFNGAVRRGYSGTAMFSRIRPLAIDCQTAPESLLIPAEGRIIAADFKEFYLVNVYTPNAQGTLARLPLRKNLWDPEFRAMLLSLDEKKPLIVCGDLNVAHKPIDLAYPDANRGYAGYTDEEREGFDGHLRAGFVDVFRHFHPSLTGAYSWWSYRSGARQRNIGWRIDYFLASSRLMKQVRSCEILPKIGGSDHAPVLLELETMGHKTEP